MKLRKNSSLILSKQVQNSLNLINKFSEQNQVISAQVDIINNVMTKANFF